jgi:hypothetical protein
MRMNLSYKIPHRVLDITKLSILLLLKQKLMKELDRWHKEYLFVPIGIFSGPSFSVCYTIKRSAQTGFEPTPLNSSL